MCLNHISIFCRHSSYYITYTIASFVNMFSLLLPRTETKQQLLCRMIAMTIKGFKSGWTLESTQSKWQTYPKELLWHYLLLKLHSFYFSVLVGAECLENGRRTPNPTEISKLKSSKPPPPFQCMIQEQIWGATVSCNCLRAEPTREMLHEFTSGKCQAKITVTTSCPGTCVGFRPDFRPSKEVQQYGCAHTVGRAGSWSLPFCVIPAGSCSRMASLSKDVLSQSIFLLLYWNSVWWG